MILEGLQGKAEGRLLIFVLRPQVSQSRYDSWRDQFLSNMGQVFAIKKIDQREAYQNLQIESFEQLKLDMGVKSLVILVNNCSPASNQTACFLGLFGRL